MHPYHPRRETQAERRAGAGRRERGGGLAQGGGALLWTYRAKRRVQATRGRRVQGKDRGVSTLQA